MGSGGSGGVKGRVRGVNKEVGGERWEMGGVWRKVGGER